MAVEISGLQTHHEAVAHTVPTKQGALCIETVDEVAIDSTSSETCSSNGIDERTASATEDVYDNGINGGDLNDSSPNENGVHAVNGSENVISTNGVESNNKTNEKEQLNNHPQSVKVPDMFGSIMSAEARVNPHHFQVKAAADAFIAE